MNVCKELNVQFIKVKRTSNLAEITEVSETPKLLKVEKVPFTMKSVEYEKTRKVGEKFSTFKLNKKKEGESEISMM